MSKSLTPTPERPFLPLQGLRTVLWQYSQKRGEARKLVPMSYQNSTVGCCLIFVWRYIWCAVTCTNLPYIISYALRCIFTPVKMLAHKFEERIPLHLQGLSPRASHSCSHPAIVLRCWQQIRHMNTCQITEGYVCLKRGLLVWCSSAIPPSYRYVVLFRIRTSQWLKITALASKPCFIWRALKN